MVRGAEIIHRLTKAVRVVLRSIKENVLKEMRETGLSPLLVARTDMVTKIDGHHGHVPILMRKRRETVIQYELLVRNAKIIYGIWPRRFGVSFFYGTQLFILRRGAQHDGQQHDYQSSERFQLHHAPQTIVIPIYPQKSYKHHRTDDKSRQRPHPKC